MPERYYRKDWVEAEQQENGDWIVQRYKIASDKWSEHILVPAEAFQKFFHKETSDAQQISEAGAHDGSSSAQQDVRQEARHPAESGEGVQQGRSGETQEIACAYAVTVDGFISIPKRAIRNPESPFLVWMARATWEQLAKCATVQGQFYIPATGELNSPEQLRMHVSWLENIHAA